MQYRVNVTKRAMKQLARIQNQYQCRIYAAMRRLSDSETWGDVRKLVNHEYDYRLRVGNYRVLFNVTEDQTLEINDIFIEEVKKRDEGTY